MCTLCDGLAPTALLRPVLAHCTRFCSTVLQLPGTPYLEAPELAIPTVPYACALCTGFARIDLLRVQVNPDSSASQLGIG